MRPRPLRSLTLGTLAATGVVGLAPAAAAVPYPPAPQASPTCAAPGDARFPLTAKIQGGPDAYRAGDDFQDWSIDLANDTDLMCAGIHPVVVLVDQQRSLQAGQVRMEFHDGTRWRPVELDRTDRDETIAVFDDGFSGFSVRPRETVSVKVRLALTADARPNQIVADAAVVARRGNDGDWVGESEDYPFAVEAADPARSDEPDPPGSSAPPSAGPTPGEDSGGGDSEDAGAGESEGGDGSRDTERDELQLAETGRKPLLVLGAAAGLLVLAGGALVALARRAR